MNIAVITCVLIIERRLPVSVHSDNASCRQDLGFGYLKAMNMR